MSVSASGSVTTSASRAAAAVTILNVEPGGYVCLIARFSIGWLVDALSSRQESVTDEPVPES